MNSMLRSWRGSLQRLAREPVQAPRSTSRAFAPRRRSASAGPARSCSNPASRGSRARTACRSSAAEAPTRYVSAGQKREESGVSSSSITRSSPASSSPNSNLVSAMMMPRSRAYSVARAYSCSEASFTLRASSAPISFSTSAMEMFSSCEPGAAFVLGVKIGWRSRSASSRPDGSSTPDTRPALAVILPAGADQVAAHDGFDRQRFQVVHDHRAVFDHSWSRESAQHGRRIDAGQMIRDDWLETLEPEVRDRGQHDTFARDRIG